MEKKKIVIYILKLIVELAVFILLVLLIVHLLKSDDGVLAKIDEGTAKEKLDTAIKIFSSTNGMRLEDAIKGIEGLENLEISDNGEEYNIKIDGQEFLVISREVIPEEEANNIEVKEVENDGEKK